MDLRRTVSRNREIFSRFKAGQTVESLGKQFSLSGERVRAILIDEKNRCIVSPEPFYRALRST
jgi:Mor family transcriptional regulator